MTESSTKFSNFSIEALISPRSLLHALSTANNNNNSHNCSPTLPHDLSQKSPPNSPSSDLSHLIKASESDFVSSQAAASLIGGGSTNSNGGGGSFPWGTALGSLHPHHLMALHHHYSTSSPFANSSVAAFLGNSAAAGLVSGSVAAAAVASGIHPFGIHPGEYGNALVNSYGLLSGGGNGLSGNNGGNSILRGSEGGCGGDEESICSPDSPLALTGKCLINLMN